MPIHRPAVFDTLRIFRFLADQLATGERVCLVTVTDVTGASVRNPGAHMAVSASGEYCGSLSGGCIERAVVGEALEAIRDGAPRQVAYGAGSPVIDIRLPCGGRVDLLFTPIADCALAASLLSAAESRQEWSLQLSTSSGEIVVREPDSSGWHDGDFHVRHRPALTLMIAGHGASVEALVKQAAAMDIACEVATPDLAIADRLRDQPLARAFLLERLSDPLPQAPDAWTACIFLFHDHDWEARLIAQALHSPAFYIGAMGSRATHEARCEALTALGMGAEALARIAAPVGLIPSSRDPETLAISIFAQVVERYNRLIA